MDLVKMLWERQQNDIAEELLSGPKTETMIIMIIFRKYCYYCPITIC